jgi:hypothetical protein
MDAAAFEAALKWMRFSALHPLALVRGPRGDLAKSGAVRRAETITHARSFALHGQTDWTDERCAA